MSPYLVLLLASFGPLLVGFIGITDDDDDEAVATQADVETPEETADDPIDIIDVVTFIENARTTGDNTGPVVGTRGTDQDEEFAAEDDEAANHDASGGEDTLDGSDLGDTLAGGNGADVIRGGGGDDALFGAFERETRPDDEAADTLDGGAGDDTLFLGDFDIGNGGEGRDTFVATQDAVEQIQIADFDPTQDAIAIEVVEPEETSITEQVVEEGGLRIELSTGLSLRLEGVGAPLAEGNVQFVSVAALADA